MTPFEEAGRRAKSECRSVIRLGYDSNCLERRWNARYPSIVALMRRFSSQSLPKNRAGDRPY